MRLLGQGKDRKDKNRLFLFPPSTIKCPYCSQNTDCRILNFEIDRIDPDVYEFFLEKGWCKSGNILYFPDPEFTCCPQIPCLVDPYISKPSRRIRRAVRKYKSKFSPSEDLRSIMKEPDIPVWLQSLYSTVRSLEESQPIMDDTIVDYVTINGMNSPVYADTFVNIPQFVETTIISTMEHYGVFTELVEKTPGKQTVYFKDAGFNDIYPILMVNSGISNEMFRSDMLLRLLRNRIFKDAFVTRSNSKLPSRLETYLQMYEDMGEMHNRFPPLINRIQTSEDISVICKNIQDDLRFTWKMLHQWEVATCSKDKNFRGIVRYRVTEILLQYIYFDICLEVLGNPLINKMVNLPLFNDHLLFITTQGLDDSDKSQAVWEIEYDRVNVTTERLELFAIYEEKVHSNVVNFEDSNEFDQGPMFATTVNDKYLLGSGTYLRLGSYHRLYYITCGYCRILAAVDCIDILPNRVISAYCMRNVSIAAVVQNKLGYISAFHDVNLCRYLRGQLCHPFMCDLGYFVPGNEKMQYKLEFGITMVFHQPTQQWFPFADAEPYLKRDLTVFSQWVSHYTGILASSRSLRDIRLHSNLVVDCFDVICKQLQSNVVDYNAMNKVLIYDDMMSLVSTESNVSEGSGYYVSYPTDISSSNHYGVISTTSTSEYSRRESPQNDSLIRLDASSKDNLFSLIQSSRTPESKTPKNGSRSIGTLSTTPKRKKKDDSKNKKITFTTAEYENSENKEFFANSVVNAIYSFRKESDNKSLMSFLASCFVCCTGKKNVSLGNIEKILGEEANEEDIDSLFCYVKLLGVEICDSVTFLID